MSEQMCKEHWDALRGKIGEVGLLPFVSKSGQEAAMRLAAENPNARLEPDGTVAFHVPAGPGGAPELGRGDATAETFDPMLDAFMAVLNNSMHVIAHAGGNPLYVVSQGDPDPLDPDSLKRAADKGSDAKVWPKCCLCYVNLVHQLGCDGCELDKVRGFDYFLDKATADALDKALALGLEPVQGPEGMPYAEGDDAR